jgi:uncharacterized protein YcfJ
MKRVTQAIVATLGLGLAGSASAAYYRGDSYFDYAHVDRVDRLIATVDETPATREECWNEPRTEFHPGADYRRETVVPETAVVDGGQTLERTDVIERGGYTTTDYQRVCRTRTEQAQSKQVIGYDVVYNYRGQLFHDRLDHDPGASVRVHVDQGYVSLAE